MRILLIEDSEATAAYIGLELTRNGYAVEHASTGEGGLQLMTSADYDLLICDVGLPDMNGFDVVKEIRTTNLHIPVLFLSAKSDVDARVMGLKAGGDDYLTKPFSFSELLARVQALLRRSGLSQEDQGILCVADLKLDLMRRKAYRDSEELPLQPLEFKLLHYLMRNEGKVLSKTMILEQMWDSALNLETNVVEVRMHHLRNKMDKPFKHRLIHTVRGIGYTLESRVCDEDESQKATA